MRVLLVQPPVFGLTVKSRIIEPLALETLAATIQDRYEVEIVDLRIEDNFKETLERFNPDVVSFTCYICQVNYVKKYLKITKEFNKNIITVVGGEQPTHVPEEFNIQELDYISMGDGDRSYPKLIDCIAKNEKNVFDIPGIVEVKDNKLIFGKEREVIKDLSKCPIPARNLTEKYRKFYKFEGWSDLGAVSTSRGCLCRCNFCSIWKIRKGIIGHFPMERVLEELKTIKEKNIYFCEAHSFQDIEYMNRLADLIVENDIHKNYMAYVRANTAVKHIDLLKKWRKIGLKKVFIGFETVTDSRLKSFNKGTGSNINEEAVRLVHGAGIEIISSFIIDLDFEKKDFDELADWVERMGLTKPVFNILTPLPGNSLYDDNPELIKKVPYEYFDFNHAVLPTKLPKDVFYRYLADLYRKTYSNDLPKEIKEKFSYDEKAMKTRKKTGELLAKNIEMSIYDEKNIVEVL